VPILYKKYIIFEHKVPIFAAFYIEPCGENH